MTNLSVNLNKIALLRNSRGNDNPNLLEFAKKFIDLGVNGITVHPRQDERHITQKDCIELSELLSDYSHVEFNIEGYPSKNFMKLIKRTKPNQCTLVPDSPEQLTSDHGWNLISNKILIKNVCDKLHGYNIRSSIFIDPDTNQLPLAKEIGVNRIELFTGAYAYFYGTDKKVLEEYKTVALMAQKLGIGVNAGHDLSLKNLESFLSIGNILEVSIGHILIIECIKNGMEQTIKNYLDICKNS